MIRSMTGFGRSTLELPDKNITVELKSLNSKLLDASLRLPQRYREKEGELRLLLTTALERGKIELNITIDQNGETGNYTFNHSLARQYYREMKTLSVEFGLELDGNTVNTIVRMPDVLKAEQAELGEEEWEMVLDKVKEALQELDNFRQEEGAVLEQDLSARTRAIEGLLDRVAPLEGTRIKVLRERLKKQLEESFAAGTVDKNRFEQEIIYYLEKLDITEEKVRLRKHCRYFTETLAEPGSNGKKLGFISQEMGREINTLGSKANDAEIQKLVILMKDELEKIKEQLFNIL